MRIKLKIANKHIWNLILGLCFLFIMSLSRIATGLVFKAPASEIGSNVSAFFLGFRYDLRYVGIVMMLVFIIGLFKKTDPFISNKGKNWTIGIWMFFSFSLFILYATDFVHFAYLHQRLNASILTYLENLSISTQMMWQSYPIIKIILGFLLSMFLFYKLILISFKLAQKTAITKSNPFTNIILFLLEKMFISSLKAISISSYSLISYLN